MANYTAEEIKLAVNEYEKAERLGTFVKANDPATQGIKDPHPRTVIQDGMVIDYDVAIPTRDGTVLRGNIYRSADGHDGKLPIILNYSVYGKDGILELKTFPASSRLDNGRVSTYYAFEAADAIWWTRRGYAVVLVDARGSFQSEGNKHYYSRDIGLDGHDVVQWLGALSCSNGKVGLYGASAFAMVQWLIAAENPSCLAAILPFDGMTDLYREMARKGGMPETQFMAVYPHLFNWGKNMVEESQNASFEHEYFDEYWQSKIPALSKVTCPAYVICGWGDHGIHTRGTLHGYKQISSKQKYLEIHSSQKWEYAVTEESLGRQKAFFDTFMLGKPTEVQFWPAVRYTMREAFYVSEWRYADHFPIPNTTCRRFFPTASGGLSDVQQSSQQSHEYDAIQGEFTLELPILESFEFAGYSKLRLWVEARDADNLDLHITLRKIDSKGQIVKFPWLTIADDGPIAFGWLRASRRELDEERSTDMVPYHRHTRDLLLKPGEVVPVDIEILPTSCRFRPGDRLQLVVSGHDYGKYPPMIPIPRHAKTVNHGTHIMHFGGKFDSYLQLPMLSPVEQSILRHGQNIKMVLISNRLAGFSDQQFLTEFAGVHAEMTKGLGQMVPYLRAYTQTISMPDKERFQTLGFGANKFEACATLGWSSLSKLYASFQHPSYKASAGKHIFADPVLIGSLCQAFGEVMFDPIRYEKRRDSVIVTVYLPRNVKKCPAGTQLEDADLEQRIETVRSASAGSSLLRYVINRDVSPSDPQEFFAGTQFEKAGFGKIGAVEQYWFNDLSEASGFWHD